MKIKTVIFILVALFVAACGASGDTFEPKTIIKEYVQALKEKNVEKIKATASTKTVKLFEDAAKAQKKSLEEMIKENQPEIQPMLENPEIRNEKVEGDRATVEIKNPKDGNWSKLVFVKEENRWKIGAGEMLEDVQKEIEKMKEEQKPAEDDSDKKEEGKEETKKEEKSEKKEDK